jgi:hypothetical protein
MKRFKKILFILPLFVLFVLVGRIYLTQEAHIFRHKTLPKDYTYSWEQPFKEYFIEVDKDVFLNALYFPSKEKKGMIFYLHGRGGNLASPWGKVAKDFTGRGYDLFIFDYRGFGKSDGVIFNESTLLSDVESVYEFVTTNFSFDQIIFYGRSLGTGLAAYLASKHTPSKLLLESPYVSLLDIAIKTKPYLPHWVTKLILKYPLRTDRWIHSVKCPIFVFHGTADTIIPHHSSIALEKICHGICPINVYLFDKAKHNHVVKEQGYQSALDKILQ